MGRLMSPSIRPLAAPDQNPRRKAWPERLSTRSDAQDSRRRPCTNISSATACAMGSDACPPPNRPVSSPLHSPRPPAPPFFPTAYSLSPRSQAFFSKNRPKSASPQHLPATGVGIDARGRVSPYVTLQIPPPKASPRPAFLLMERGVRHYHASQFAAPTKLPSAGAEMRAPVKNHLKPKHRADDSTRKNRESRSVNQELLTSDNA